MINCCHQVNLPKPNPMSLPVTISKEKLEKIKIRIKNLFSSQAEADLIKLFDEGALISRMCCKVKKKFRGEKLFRRLKQITISIRKLHMLNILEIKSILLATFENGMPTKQAGQWAGTRILAAFNLINQLLQFSEAIAQLIVKVFQNGQCWLEVNIALAMVSRVWILTKSLHKSFLHSYQHFIPIVNQLRKTEIEWLTNIELPKNLNDNLVENIDNEPELVENPGSVMCRKPNPEKLVTKKRKRPGKQIRMLQEKCKNQKKVLNIRKKQKLMNQ